MPNLRKTKKNTKMESTTEVVKHPQGMYLIVFLTITINSSNRNIFCVTRPLDGAAQRKKAFALLPKSAPYIAITPTCPTSSLSHKGAIHVIYIPSLILPSPFSLKDRSKPCSRSQPLKKALPSFRFAFQSHVVFYLPKGTGREKGS